MGTSKSDPRLKRDRRAQRPGARARAGRAAPPSGRLPEGPQRLQKLLAAAGLGSRRQCETLIAAGRVEVDRRVVRDLGAKADPDAQEIRVDGAAVSIARKAYYLVNKPQGVVSTARDPAGRTRVIDLVPNRAERLFTVGRLDLASEGLILLTNDGALANRLAHPRYGVEKTYQVLVAGTPTPEQLSQLRQGIHLAEGVARVRRVRVKTAMKKSTLLEMVLDEGRNREIRRLLAKIGHKVLRLKRTAIGGLRLKNLAPGEYRRLTGEEVRQLQAGVRRDPAPKRPDDSAALPAIDASKGHAE